MRVPERVRLLPSVFDRLADVSFGGVDSEEWYDVAMLTRAVRRDLEDLLNTQRSIPNLEAEFPHLAASVIGYGIPDPSNFPLDTPSGRRALAAAIAETVTTFEPRLTDVRIELGDVGGQKLRDLRFRVIARLAVEPAPRVVFESRLHVSSGQFSVSEDAT